MFARTDRLLLRPHWPEDARELHSTIADEQIVRNLSRAPWPYGLSDAQEFVSREASMEHPTFLLMQRTEGAPRLVGGCGLHEEDGNLELGYWIAQPYWGLGYATEAARALVGIARALGHSKIHARHFIDNPASGRVLRKAGFRATGKTASLQSRGRGQAAPCALYEQDLAGDDGDSDAGMPVMPGIPSIRYIMERQAA